MSEFEFLFVLYSLVLGLSLVELLTGLGRALEFKLAREADGKVFAIGWLTPMLAVFVILDLLSFWLFSWRVRDHVAVSTGMALGVLVFASAYFLASRLVFPSSPENFTDLDTHYHRVQRIIFAMLILLVAVQWLFLLSIPVMAALLVAPFSLLMLAVLVLLMVAGAIIKNRKASIAVLALLILRYIVIYLM